MGLFGRKSGGKSGSGEGHVGTATVTGSSMVPNVITKTGVYHNVEERENALNAFNLGTIPHDLTLDVRIAGRAPFEVTKRFAVPAKATGRQGYELPVGLELPVTLAGDDPSKVEIEWKAFLAAPDSKKAVQKAASQQSFDEAKKYTEAAGLTEKTWANAAAGMPMWVEAVRQGKMKRKAFDQQVDTLSRIGQMDPELAAEGKRTLDAEGFTL